MMIVELPRVLALFFRVDLMVSLVVKNQWCHQIEAGEENQAVCGRILAD